MVAAAATPTAHTSTAASLPEASTIRDGRVISGRVLRRGPGFEVVGSARGWLEDPDRDDGEQEQGQHRHGEHDRRLGRLRQAKSVHRLRLSPMSTANNGVRERLHAAVGAGYRQGRSWRHRLLVRLEVQ